MVTVFDAGCTDDGVVWVAMELLEGSTLREVLTDRRRLPPGEAVACAIDVGEAVGAAHRERIIHRDLKPENIFVTQAGAIKVLDLGTMKQQGWGELKTTERRRVVGTPASYPNRAPRCPPPARWRHQSDPPPSPQRARRRRQRHPPLRVAPCRFW